jgi:Trk K+ transport system NAD-binding subunit
MMSGHLEHECTIIAGGGRLGRCLADRLSEADEPVTLIDVSEQLLSQMSSGFRGAIVEGDASDIEVLRQAGIHHAKAMIAATDDDDVNLMIAHISRDIYEIASVIAVVQDMEILKAKDGFNFTILCPALVMTQAIMGCLDRKGE